MSQEFRQSFLWQILADCWDPLLVIGVAFAAIPMVLAAPCFAAAFAWNGVSALMIAITVASIRRSLMKKRFYVELGKYRVDIPYRKMTVGEFVQWFDGFGRFFPKGILSVRAADGGVRIWHDGISEFVEEHLRLSREGCLSVAADSCLDTNRRLNLDRFRSITQVLGGEGGEWMGDYAEVRLEFAERLGRKLAENVSSWPDILTVRETLAPKGHASVFLSCNSVDPSDPTSAEAFAFVLRLAEAEKDAAIAAFASLLASYPGCLAKMDAENVSFRREVVSGIRAAIEFAWRWKGETWQRDLVRNSGLTEERFKELFGVLVPASVVDRGWEAYLVCDCCL